MCVLHAHHSGACLRHVYDCHVTPSTIPRFPWICPSLLPLCYMKIQIFASICVVLASGAVSGSPTGHTAYPSPASLPIPFPFPFHFRHNPIVSTHTHTHAQLNGRLMLMTRPLVYLVWQPMSQALAGTLAMAALVSISCVAVAVDEDSPSSQSCVWLMSPCRRSMLCSFSLLDWEEIGTASR